MTENEQCIELCKADSGEKRPLLNAVPEDEQEDDTQKSPPPHSPIYKLTRLIMVMVMATAMGAFNEATGPIIPELIVQTNSSYEQIMTAISMRAGGHMIGGILGGLLVDALFRYIDIFNAVCTALYTALSIAAVYSTSITVMTVIFFLQGLFVTVIDISNMQIILTTYKENSATPCLVWKLGYFVGGIAGPMIVEPFVDGRFSGLRFNRGRENNMTTKIGEHNNTVTESLYHYPGNFVTAYWLIVGLVLLVSVSQLGLHIYGKVTGINLIDYIQSENTEKSLQEKLSFRSCSPSRPILAAAIILAHCFFYGGVSAILRALPKTIFSYDRDGPGLSVSESSSMTSAFFISSAAGIIISILPTSFFHIKYVLQVQTTLLLIVCILIYFLYRNVTALWTLFLSVGFLCAPLAPSGFAMLNRYILVTPISQILPHIGVAICDVIAMVAIGFSYETYGPYSIWSVLLILGIMTLTSAVCMQIVAHLLGDRHTSTEKDQ